MGDLWKVWRAFSDLSEVGLIGCAAAQGGLDRTRSFTAVENEVVATSCYVPRSIESFVWDYLTVIVAGFLSCYVLKGEKNLKQSHVQAIPL